MGRSPATIKLINEAYGMGIMIIATITSQGYYADNKDMCELYISKESSEKMPHEPGKKTPIDIKIGENLYEGGIHETQEGIVWMSSVYKKAPKREKIRLVDALERIGLKKGAKLKIMKNTDDNFFCL
jgi:hypothetical protein